MLRLSQIQNLSHYKSSCFVIKIQLMFVMAFNVLHIFSFFLINCLLLINYCDSYPYHFIVLNDEYGNQNLMPLLYHDGLTHREILFVP
jgi:hypothetical protein